MHTWVVTVFEFYGMLIIPLLLVFTARWIYIACKNEKTKNENWDSDLKRAVKLFNSIVEDKNMSTYGKLDHLKRYMGLDFNL